MTEAADSNVRFYCWPQDGRAECAWRAFPIIRDGVVDATDLNDEEFEVLISRLGANSMTTETHSNGQIEISADFAQASSQILWRHVGDEEWKATPYQVADAGHDAGRALGIVDSWLDAQS